MQSFIQSNADLVLLFAGLAIGGLFGLLLQRTNFCVMGALSDAMTFGDRRRLYAWLLAATLAIAGTQILAMLDVVLLERSFHLVPRLNWAGHTLGGLLFGAGMVLAGGCASRNLIRAASGDIRSLLLLGVIAFFAYVTLSGVLASARVAFADWTALDISRFGLASQHSGDIIALLLGLDPMPARLMLTALICGLGLAVAFAHRPFRTSPKHVTAGLGVGLAATAAWTLTSLAFDDLASRPIEVTSLSFVRPLADTLDWLQRSTALGLPEFAVAAVIGTAAGAFLAAMVSGTFKVMTFADTGDTLRHLAGGAMMGVGGVMALGCTIGQGISGVATLGLGSMIAAASIATGAILMIARLSSD